MNARVFVDANIVIYAHDAEDPAKHATARQLMADLWGKRQGVTSAQVLGESFVILTRKLRIPLSSVAAEAVVHGFEDWPVIPITRKLVEAAVQLSMKSQISYWDTLIVMAAKEAGASVILTEDLNHGQVIEGIRIHNPFKESF